DKAAKKDDDADAKNAKEAPAPEDAAPVEAHPSGTVLTTDSIVKYGGQRASRGYQDHSSLYAREKPADAPEESAAPKNDTPDPTPPADSTEKAGIEEKPSKPKDTAKENAKDTPKEIPDRLQDDTTSPAAGDAR